jgi:hypothetical protein
VKASLVFTREAFRSIFFQRCFYLFITLLALIALTPFVASTPGGMILRSLLNTFVILCAVASVGRSLKSFMAVLALALPSLTARWLSIRTGDPAFFDAALRFDVAIYLIATTLLLRYVFDKETMSADRLWGAAASYLMIGVLWAFLYAIIDRENAASFAVHGKAVQLTLHDLIYFSFSTLSTTGFGDIAALTPAARTGTVIEGVIGQLFLAILIAKLVGIYPESMHFHDAHVADHATGEIPVNTSRAHTAP